MAEEKEEKQVRISKKVHAEISQLANVHSMNIGGLVDAVCRFWLAGELYLLPLVKPYIKSSDQPTSAPATAEK